MLTTSGVDGVYPPGLPVAKIDRIERRADSAFARIHCVPLAPCDGGALRAGAGADRRAADATPAPPRRQRRGRRRRPTRRTPRQTPRRPRRQEGGAAMIMRPGQQQLLLPVNPLFIWGSLIVALLLNMLPLGRAAWMPDLLALVLVFWSVHQPRAHRHRRGLRVRPADGRAPGGLLGQHALSYTDAGLLRDHDPPPPAVVSGALAGAAGAAAVRAVARHRARRSA